MVTSMMLLLCTGISECKATEHNRKGPHSLTVLLGLLVLTKLFVFQVEWNTGIEVTFFFLQFLCWETSLG